jgi:hypothetical protein
VAVDELGEKHDLWHYAAAERAVLWCWSEVPVAGRVVRVGLPETSEGALAEVLRADLSADGEVLYVLARAAWEDESQGDQPGFLLVARLQADGRYHAAIAHELHPPDELDSSARGSRRRARRRWPTSGPDTSGNRPAG